jgi:hypothetical protein
VDLGNVQKLTLDKIHGMIMIRVFSEDRKQQNQKSEIRSHSAKEAWSDWCGRYDIAPSLSSLRISQQLIVIIVKLIVSSQ